MTLRISAESRDGNWVYNQLRHEIENLELKPGEELDVLSIADRYGVSRSPVRDALLRLKRDCLVDIFPQRGTRVSYINIHQITEERFMRRSLELNALELLLDKSMSSVEKQAFSALLESNLLKQHAALLADDPIELLKGDDELHHMFFSAVDLEEVWSILKAHTGNEYRIRMLSYMDRGIADSVEEQHRELIDAIISGDKDKAIDLDKKHLLKINDELNGLRETFSEYFIEDKK